jgi:hypothetical protein
LHFIKTPITPQTELNMYGIHLLLSSKLRT